MEITWSEADPDHLFRALQGLAVTVNGDDASWGHATRAGLVLLDLDADTGQGVPGTERLIDWDDVRTVYVY